MSWLENFRSATEIRAADMPADLSKQGCVSPGKRLLKLQLAVAWRPAAGPLSSAKLASLGQRLLSSSLAVAGPATGSDGLLALWGWLLCQQC
jgi:hypothetical protein